MPLHVYEDLEQGSDEWLAARAGIVTASTIGKLITPTLKVASNDTSRGLITTLAAERITGHVEPMPVNAHMIRGTEDEPVARDYYSRLNNVRVEEVGFMVREDNGIRLGYSPDGLIANNGLLEIKSRLQKAQVQTVLADKVPAANMAQLQAGLFVTGRDWIDYVSYSAGMALYINRVNPDPDWFRVIADAATQAEEAITAIVNTYLEKTTGLPITEPRVDLDDITI